MSAWTPSGWVIATGHVIQLSLFLPAGVHAEVRRNDKRRWSYNFRASGRYNPTGSFKSKTAAMQACETALVAELKSAIRMLQRSTKSPKQPPLAPAKAKHQPQRRRNSA